MNVAVSFSGAGSTDPDGTVAAYWWQYGDGGSNTNATPAASHTYTAIGTYTVTLWVRDNAGAWSLTNDLATVVISAASGSTTTSSTSTSTSRPTTTSTTPLGPSTTTTTLPNAPPVANAGPDQLTQTLTSITFNGAGSTDSDGTITLASWNFGDGTTAGGLTTSHSYTTAGTYTATLTVTDNKGASDTDTAVVTVQNRPPNANAGPDAATPPNSMVTLNGSASSDMDGTIVSYAWTFGDGTSGSGPTPAHAYATTGTYTATLNVTDNNGAHGIDSTSVTVSNGITPWARAIGSTDSDVGYAVAGDAAGNTFVGGVFHGTVNFGGTTYTSAGGSDWFIAKYSPTGLLLWAKAWGGASEDLLDALAVDGAGNVVASGRFSGTSSFGGTALVANGSIDMIVAKYSGADGTHQWSKRFGGVYQDAASAIAVDGSNNVYFTGYFRGTVDFGGGPLTVPYDSDLDVFIAKLTSAGAHVWSEHFTNTGNERGYGIAVDTTGNVAITGDFTNTVDFGGGPLTSPNAMTDAFVARFTAAGAHTWSRQIGAADGGEGGNAVAMDPSGNVVITGYAIKPVDFGGGLLSALGSTDVFVAKYAATSGTHMWSRRLGGLGSDYGYGVAVDASSNVYVAGAFGALANFGGISLLPVGYSDAFVAKYNSTGTLQWAKGLGGIDNDIARGIGIGAGAPVTTGYFYDSGSFNGTTLTSAGAADAFVVRIAP